MKGYEIARAFSLVGQSFGVITSFKAYLDLRDGLHSNKVATLRSQLQSSGVTVRIILLGEFERTAKYGLLAAYGLSSPRSK